jgi:hypothetical protein
MDIWFYGMDSRDGLTEEEKAVLRPWNEAFARFVRGEEMDGQWKTKDVRQMVRLREDGVTDVWVDNRWQEGVQCWKAVNESTGGWWTWVRSKL